MALGNHAFLWRPLDRKGRIPFGIPREAKTLDDCLERCHRWLDRLDPDIDCWWFCIQEIAKDEYDAYHVIVDYNDWLVYRETLWTGFRPSLRFHDRREACCG